MSEQESPIVGAGGANKPETTESTATGSALPTPANDPSADPKDGRSSAERADREGPDDKDDD